MYDASLWQPSADRSILQRRAQLLKAIRAFFEARDVMEVDTQCLSLGSITDPHIEVLTSHTRSQGQDLTYYLQTSPEFAMKRLLCAGSGSIYQLGKVFRAEEMGRRHSIEFTLLEWYRVSFDHWQLMDEIQGLLSVLLGDDTLTCERLSYQMAFLRHLGFDPFTATLCQLQESAHEHTEYGLQENDRDTLLELLFSSVVEPAIGQDRPCFVHSYPASQAALAKTHRDETGLWVAARFELYWQGMELANGYHELTDAKEQAKRFGEDKETRGQMGLATRQFDERLISALEHGLPDCAGVALGVDRLLMLMCGKSDIAEVLPFAHARA
ncbi:EF-P lysine aminoacylase GenX [Marinomonas sp. M1K-6]|uniref:EF-P lysine aminoacylase GenX n=1 Tax=Marinomonas profundi TaxID=2726122 RepID=A0A847R5W2_9GAMM|nr:EF-P lysine aminoacylase EpmA [Marinomonas profundi]NLQ16447.1 EF-P lysine aminoacylase GenX [Marinomonas profundi]UDV03962.1 EF-P lysine aminoacylase GenX [Marinomonas profundi]